MGFLYKGSSNNASLIRFLCTEWKHQKYRSKLRNRTMFLAFEEECWMLNENTAVEVTALRCNHEEADTRLLLHAKSAAEDISGAVVIVCEDTDVFVLAVACAKDDIDAPLYQKRGTASRTRYVNITEISHVLGPEMCKSLPGLHSFTGCDTVSAFAGKGKLTALKKVRQTSEFQSTFKDLGTEAEVQ